VKKIILILLCSIILISCPFETANEDAGNWKATIYSKQKSDVIAADYYYINKAYAYQPETEIAFTVKKETGYPTYDFGIIFNYQDTKNYHFFDVRYGTSTKNEDSSLQGEFRIGKIVAGETTYYKKTEGVYIPSDDNNFIPSKLIFGKSGDKNTFALKLDAENQKMCIYANEKENDESIAYLLAEIPEVTEFGKIFFRGRICSNENFSADNEDDPGKYPLKVSFEVLDSKRDEAKNNFYSNPASYKNGWQDGIKNEINLDAVYFNNSNYKAFEMKEAVAYSEVWKNFSITMKKLSGSAFYGSGFMFNATYSSKNVLSSGILFVLDENGNYAIQKYDSSAEPKWSYIKPYSKIENFELGIDNDCEISVSRSGSSIAGYNYTFSVDGLTFVESGLDTLGSGAVLYAVGTGSSQYEDFPRYPVCYGFSCDVEQ